MRVRKEEEEKRKAEVERIRAMSEEDREVFMLLKEIEAALNPHCPACKLVFTDFDNCQALTCENEQCGIAFCALCWEECEPDEAHRHVANCRLNPYPGKVFGDQAGLDYAWKIKRTEEITKIIKRRQLSEAVRARLQNECQHHFANHKLTIDIRQIK